MLLLGHPLWVVVLKGKQKENHILRGHPFGGLGLVELPGSPLAMAMDCAAWLGMDTQRGGGFGKGFELFVFGCFCSSEEFWLLFLLFGFVVSFSVESCWPVWPCGLVCIQGFTPGSAYSYLVWTGVATRV